MTTAKTTGSKTNTSANTAAKSVEDTIALRHRSLPRRASRPRAQQLRGDA